MEGRFLRRVAAVCAALSLAVPVSATVATPEASAANSGGTQQMYRMYNRISHEHLYTADSHERDVLAKGDWNYEGVGWVAPVKSSSPVFRLYNPVLGDHHYTTDRNEVKVLTSSYGWKSEGTGWYSSDGKEVPVYRQFNPGLRVGSHNYTTDLNEYKVNNARNGWKGEGVAWYAVQEGWQVGKEPRTAAVAEPTPSDKDGKASDTFTIPSTSGVTYSVGGKTLKAGTYKVSDYATYTNNKATVKITAQATNGTRLPGTSEWTFTFDELAVATPKDVTFTDKTGTTNDTFTIPTTTGVLYYVGNQVMSAGTHKVSEVATYSATGGKATVTVTARAASGYRIDGKTSWVGTFDSESVAAANAVAFDDRDGMASDTFTVPSTTGITYAVNGRTLAAGVYKVADYATYTNYKAPVKIQATAQAGYRVNGTSTWAHTFDGLTEAPSKAATFVDKNGMASDTFTIPDVAGLQYKAGGKNVGAGTYQVADYFNYGKQYSVAAEITASAKAGYRLTGTNAWSKTISGITTVAPTAVSFTDKNGTASDTFKVPEKAGVQYRVNGKNIAAGTYKVADYFDYGSKYSVAAVVAAVPKAGYALSGTTEWSKTISGITTVAPAAVSFTDENGMASDTFTVPTKAGVQYKVNGKNIAKGTYKVADYFDYGSKYSVAAVVTAAPKAGYALSGTTEWSQTISGITTVSAEAVTFVDKNGTANDTFTVPEVTGVQYKAGGKNVAKGTYKVANYFDYGTAHSVKATVTASPKAGYAIDGAKSWSKTISGITTTSANAVTFTDENGMASDTFTVPSKAGVQYQVNGKNIAAGTYKVRDYFSYGSAYSVDAIVTAVAADGYKLSGTTQWSQTISGITTTSASAITFTDENGMASDTFTVPSKAGVQYRVNGKNIAAGTYKVADYFDYGTAYSVTAKITAVPKAGYALSGTTQWSKKISGITTVTPGAVTFTEKNGMASDTFTVPNTQGVQYSAGGKNVAAGTYKVKDYFDYGSSYSAKATIKATAKAGYKLSGTTSWAQTFDGITATTASAVTFVDQNGMASDTFTVPTKAGVQYQVNGKNIAAGTYKVADYFDYGSKYSATATITAIAKAGYSLSGTTQWSKKISGITTVTPGSVTFTEKNGMASDTFTVPNTEGVQYSAGGKNVAAGTYKVRDYFDYGTAYATTATITAKAKAGYKLSGDTQWVKDFDGISTVAPAAVSFTDENGMASDTFTVPTKAGVQYQVNGKNIAAGTYKIADYFDYGSKYSATATVTAKAKAGYKLTGDTQWRQEMDGLYYVQSLAPTFTDDKGDEKDTVKIPSVEGVQYKLNGTSIAAGTYKVADKVAYEGGKAPVVVTAQARAGYKITNDTTWNHTFTSTVSVSPTAPSFADVDGLNGDTFTIPTCEGVAYSVGGKALAAGTYSVKDYATYSAGKAAVKVTAAAASSEYELTGTKQWTGSFTAVAVTRDPSFVDNSYSNNDYIVIPENEGVYYTIDGVRVEAGRHAITSYPNGMHKAEVHAYVDPAYENQLSVAIWHGTFYDGQPWVKPTPAMEYQSGGAAFGTKSLAETKSIVQSYAQELTNAASAASTYSGYTSVADVFGKSGNSVDQPWSDTATYSDAMKELQHRYEVRYHERVNELRSRIGAGSLLLMRLNDSQESQMFGHAAFTQQNWASVQTGPLRTDSDLWAVVNSTLNSDGQGWGGGKSSTYEVLVNATSVSTAKSPEQLADEAVVAVLAEYPNLTKSPTSSNQRLYRMLDYRNVTLRPTLYLYDASDSAVSVLSVGDNVRSSKFTG